MAKTDKKSNTTKKETSSGEKKSFKLKPQHKVLIGSVIVLFSVGLLVAFISFFVNGYQNDQSTINEITNRNEL
jgi:DNA segregation ATPase FtsK/SpoIIIE, S-DNA-T family